MIDLAVAAATPTPVGEPRRSWVVANVLVMQVGWFACVLGAAQGYPSFGALLALPIVGWHLGRAARALPELKLIACAVGLGALLDAAMLASGALVYPNGQWAPLLTPFWMAALWAEFATSLNVSLRWLKGRPLLAAILGAVAGPLSLMAGMRLGAAHFNDPTLALGLFAVGWAIAMPLLLRLSRRFDGVGRMDRAKELA